MKKFYLGMDIGTESVGMACTDEQYNLLRAKGKDLWVVRLFDKAEDAKDRRAKRTARRRLQRRKQRIEFLQGFFAPFMEDNTFFIRLNNSGFYEEDKDERLETKFSLFADSDYTDREFYQAFPTIFHLRKALIDGEKADLRHFYLALHHIIKYRGHFLFEGEDVSAIRDIKKLFQNYNAFARELDIEIDVQLNEEKADEFKALALARKRKDDKKKEGATLFGATTIAKKEWIALLLGAKVSLKKLFGEEYEEKYKEQSSFSFDGLADENFEAMQDIVEEEHFELLRASRDIYNFIVFEKVLEGNENISTAMVALYEKHKADLAMLKKFVKENYSKEIYYKIFRSKNETANYVNYIGYNRKKSKKEAVKRLKPQDLKEFYKFLEKTLKSIPVVDEEKLRTILAEIENKTFLPKILNADNGLFPHQINGIELDLILKNLCKQYPVFDEKFKDGYSVAEKIKAIFLFKIPYYVGPLNPHGKNGWIIRQEGRTDKITPWNFDKVVDKAKSNEEFIRRMTNKCTYLHNQDVLPKGSMYYQAYDVLNQINKLRLNGELISVELKQAIFENVYLKNKKVGVKQIKEYLVASGVCTQAESKSILSGFDAANELKASMNSYVTFKNKFGSLVDEKPEIFENIILWHTLNTDKSLVVETILKEYGNILGIKDNIAFLKGLTSFKEFGKYSKKLLYGLYGADKSTGEVYTILNRLYHTTDNFNQLLFSEDYNFAEQIDNENAGKDNAEIKYEDVEELYVAPMVRRGVWQALQMADEYVKAVGKVPDKIFIEVTRQDGEKGDKGRTVSRKAKILELYKGLGADCREIDGLVKELNHEDMTDARLRSERLYLYFLQLGRCAYTGNPIRLEELFGDLYDVDHIIPQSMTKDDSLDNKVLVERVKNAEKTNVYPLPQGFTTQQSFWRMLKDKGLMSLSKYARLTRTKPLTEDDFREFINRQLVVTNQTVKAVAELLKRKYEPFGTKIVYSKAKNVDDFKQKQGIIKCRETNDLHHARDAYLNIVVGNIYHTKFTSNYAYFYSDKEGVQRGYNLERIYYWKIDGAWSGKDDIERVKKIVAKTSVSVTRYATSDKGKFYKETIYKKGDKSASCPRKGIAPYNIKDENGLYKYGGYSGVQSAYFVALEYTEGKKRKKVVLGLPIMTEYQIHGDMDKIKCYFEGEEGLKDVKILAKIKKGALICYKGYKCYLSGASDNRILLSNAVQWFSKPETDNYVKGLFALFKMSSEGRLTSQEQQKEEFLMHTNRFKDKALVINRDNNQRFYQLLLEQIGIKVYKGIPAFQTLKSILELKKGTFETLSVWNQVRCLTNIVNYLRRANSNGLDLSTLGESKSSCALRVGYDISMVDFSIIHQSPCGLVERVQEL